MKEQITTHEEELVNLRRIEGQIRGLQRMIEEKRYCVDILTVISSIIGALRRVRENILERHLKGCVQQSFSSESREAQDKKITEIIEVIRKFGGN